MEKGEASWKTLFERFPFFEAYKNYLQIDISAENEDDSRKWKGWVESRLRLLTLKVRSHCFSFLDEVFLSSYELFSDVFHAKIFLRLRGTWVVYFSAIHTLVNLQTVIDVSIIAILWA